jgi:hypothetical protein
MGQAGQERLKRARVAIAGGFVRQYPFTIAVTGMGMSVAVLPSQVNAGSLLGKRMGSFPQVSSGTIF